jgi:hypothetical protein
MDPRTPHIERQRLLEVGLNGIANPDRVPDRSAAFDWIEDDYLRSS